MYNYISIKYIDIFKCNYIKVFSMGGKKDFHIILPGRGRRHAISYNFFLFGRNF